jgi:hypothetical protein
MAGVAGRSGGRNAKRPEAKLGHPKTAANAATSFDRIDASDHEEAVIPEPNPEWGTAALLVWESVVNSPTKIFAESSDYAYLYITCEAVNSMAESGYKGILVQAVNSLFSNLGMTEIQRRAAKILIDRTPAPPELAPVAQIDDAKRHFG